MRRIMPVLMVLAAVTALPARADHTPLCGIGPDAPGAAVGVVACDGVRPGGRLSGGCTLNFVFLGSDERTYVGTAGHCISTTMEFERSWSPGTGPPAQHHHGGRIGEFVYAVRRPPKDFALIRLEPSVRADPQVAHFGGPTGINQDISSGPALLGFVGWGRPSDPWPATTARPILAESLCSPDAVFGAGPAAGGDSGSPVVDSQRRAVGVLVGYLFDSDADPACPTEGTRITRLGPQLARAGEVLGVELSIMTAPPLG